MSGLKVIGAGIGRTGTTSLQAALEQLLGGRCYHMFELADAHIPMWTAAARGQMPDWDALFDGYVAAVDWPTAAFWPELAARWPDAVVVLSHRDPAAWWKSASDTIFTSFRTEVPEARRPFDAMVREMMASRFTPDFLDPTAAMAAAARHDAAVRANADPRRLVEWTPDLGWAPLCAALDLPVPDAPFPHHNTTAAFQERIARRRGVDDAPADS